MDERQAASVAAELGISAEELRALDAELTGGMPEALVAGLIRFEDALFELAL